MSGGADESTTRRLRLRYAATCSTCGIAISPGTEAIWDRDAKTATCLPCSSDEVSVDAGTAGASAVAEGKRRQKRRVDEVRRRHGDHAAHVAEVMAAADPTIESWSKGGAGESRLAAFVERKVGDRVIALHDRVIPGTRRNVDHLFVARSGVWVVDAKSYKGKVVKRDVGPFWRSEYEFYVGGRNRTKLANAMASQLEAVRAALGPDLAVEGTQLHAALCFVDSDWGLLDRPFQVGAVWVLYPRALEKRLKKDGQLSRNEMELIAKRLALSLPSAV